MTGIVPGVISEEEVAAKFEITVDELRELGIPHVNLGERRWYLADTLSAWMGEQQRLQEEQRAGRREG